MKKIFFLTLIITATLGCQKDFLDRPPLDALTDESYWTNEEKVRVFAWDFYPRYFTAYGSGFAWGKYFSGESFNDDFAPSVPGQFIRNVPATSSAWNFTAVRRINIYIDRISRVPMEEEDMNHWLGVARFFRAMEYANLVKAYGDVPWFDAEIMESDLEIMYKPRDPRLSVMDNVLADLQFAYENVREADGEKGLVVTKAVVLAFMSRILLFEGTWQLYHDGDEAKARTYLEASRDAARQVMEMETYTPTDDYRAMFSSLSLATSVEMIMYRKYETGMLMHSLNSYVNKEPQSGISKSAIDSYLCSDGLPIEISKLYKGDKTITNVLAARDPRMLATVVDSLRIAKYSPNFSSSGYSIKKFLNEEVRELPEGNGALNQTDGPVIRMGEVLMNYIEAAAELGPVTQEDLDISINLLRNRPGIDMPALQVRGGKPAVNGVVYDDPGRDQDVSSLLWEIRRERRVELMMEGFRRDDLARWGKFEYLDMEQNPTINQGAWITRSQYPETDVNILGGADAGYIVAAPADESQRRFEDPKVYLDPLPLDQINLYEQEGYDLAQNPGW